MVTRVIFVISGYVDPGKGLGDVTSMNVTMLRAGVAANGADVINVVPPFAEAGLDIRM
jgi:hypothetical protein